jgi:hypothetical protein
VEGIRTDLPATLLWFGGLLLIVAGIAGRLSAEGPRARSGQARRDSEERIRAAASVDVG